MIYLTGDTHGRFDRIGSFCGKMQTSRDDILIILGDAGINFHAGALDILRKEYYICRRTEHDRAEAITNYIERIRRTLHSYLDASLPSELKDDLQLTDDLEDAVAPMCSKLIEQIGYDPEVRLCTITSTRIVWHREETAEAGFKETDELVVIDEYGKVIPLKEFLASVGVTNIT